MTDVLMPQMGQTMDTGVVLAWLKRESERVEKGEPLLEIETDKTTAVVESPASGVLTRIEVQEGEEVPVLALLGVIDDA